MLVERFNSSHFFGLWSIQSQPGEQVFFQELYGPGRKKNPPILVQHFKTPACKQCPVINACTRSTHERVRVIERSEFQRYVDQNKKNTECNRETYRRRQAIIEHTYGIIKRQWGFY
ncbi:MAG: transposase [Ignavibacteria bacterium]|nr:transposase [Ignavibacteria bacterium]